MVMMMEKRFLLLKARATRGYQLAKPAAGVFGLKTISLRLHVGTIYRV